MNKPAGTETQEQSGQLVLLRVPLTVGVLELSESLEEIEEKSGDTSLFFWVLGLLFFGLGDTISSLLVFSKGGSELNPLLRWSMGLPGGLLGFVLVKTVALSVLYAVTYLWEGVHQWVIPLMMTLAGVYLTVSNMLVFMSLR